MEVKEAIFSRRSVRDFKPEPPSRELVEEVLKAGIWAPSNSNRQPWEFLVIGGKYLNQLVKQLNELLGKPGKTRRDLPTWDDKYPPPPEGERRRKELMRGLLESAKKAGLEPGEFIKRNFSFFGAPVVILVLMDKGYGIGSLVSVGACIQNILLRAYELGLGTCWMMIPLEYGEVFREMFQIPENKYLVSTIALGYPGDSPLNQFRSSRDSLEKLTRWFWE